MPAARVARRARGPREGAVGGVPRPDRVRDSRVAVTSYLERRWYLTTEGTSVTDTRRASGVVIVGERPGRRRPGRSTQYFLRYGHTAKDLPSDDELKAEAKQLVDTIGALREGAGDRRATRGPVLFEGEGAVGLIRATLAPHLGGTPVPEGLNPQEAKHVRRRAHREGRAPA